VGGRADQRARLAAAESEGGAPVGLARLAGPSGRGARRLRQGEGELGRRLPGKWLAGRKQGKEGEKKKRIYFPFSNDFPNFIFN